MKDTILSPGEKIHVLHRFDKEIRLENGREGFRLGLSCQNARASKDIQSL